MGCGCTSARKRGALAEELQAHDAELAAERQRIQDRGLQFEAVQEQLRNTERASASDNRAADRSLDAMRAELRAQEEEQSSELLRHRERLQRRHTEQLEDALRERDATLRSTLASHQYRAEGEFAVEEEAAARSLRERVRDITKNAEAEAAQHREETEAAEKEASRLREELQTLRLEHNHAAENWQSVRQHLEAQCETNRAAVAGEATASALDRQLATVREDHSRTQLRYTGMEKHLRAQICSLKNEFNTRSEELQNRGLSVQQRERELLEVHTELADLQPLFDEVNNKLQSECGRVDKLEAAVQYCAKQSKELESLQHMLEDSHQMLGQVRDALEHERAERIRTAGVLEHEQHRTRLLLDVLRHFKEKLQGLTPQMLMNRLSCSDENALLDLGVSGGRYSVGSSTPSTAPSPKGANQFYFDTLLEPIATASGIPRVN